MKPLLYLTVFIALVSCSPQALVPFEFDPLVDKEPVSIIEANDLKVYMENIERKNDLLIFDLEVVNNSDRPIKINMPELYYYAGYDKFLPVHDTASMDIKYNYAQRTHKFNRRRAMTLSKVEKYYEDKVSDGEGLGIFLLLLGAGLIINDVVQDANDSQKSFWTESDNNRAITRDVLTAGSLLAIDIAANEAHNSSIESEEELHYAPYEIFPEQQIAPGEGLRGKVFFPYWESFKYYRFILPISNTDFIFDFRKRKQADREKLQAYDLRR